MKNQSSLNQEVSICGNENADDYDSPWKEAVERYFTEFMSFYFLGNCFVVQLAHNLPRLLCLTLRYPHHLKMQALPALLPA